MQRPERLLVTTAPLLVVLSGHPHPDSRTLRLATAAGREVAAQLGAGVPGVVDVASFGRELLDPGVLADQVDLLRQAEVVVVATPAYRGTFTGLLKVVLDALPGDGLAHAVALPVVTAGSPDHLASTERAVREVLAELGAHVGPALAMAEGELAGPADLITGYAARAATEVRAAAGVAG